MVADGFGADDQMAGDFGVFVALGDENQDFALPVAELGEKLRAFSRLYPGKKIHQASSNSRTEDGLAAAHGPHRPDHFIMFGAFEDITSAPGTHGGKNRAVVIKHGHDQDPNVGAGVDDPAGGFDPI